MNPVLEFLQKHPDYSFDEGVAVLLRYSANRGVNTFITMRRDRQHLRNELNRLAHIPQLRPLPGMEEPKPTENEQKQLQAAKDLLKESEEGLHESESSLKEESVADIIAHQDTLREVIKGGDITNIVSAKEGLEEAWKHAEAKPIEPIQAKPKPDENEPKPEESSQNKGTTAADEDDTVTYLDLKRHEQYDPEKLPPTLKELWLKNRDEYKELQYCHAQMKQANSDAGRADWRRQVDEHREALEARWKLFDEEKTRLETLAAEEPGQEPAAYNPSNDRSYISKALGKETWTDKMKLEVQHRVDTMLANGIPFEDETLQRLKERGITIE
jgi:hypothetical protein